MLISSASKLAVAVACGQREADHGHIVGGLFIRLDHTY